MGIFQTIKLHFNLIKSRSKIQNNNLCLRIFSYMGCVGGGFIKIRYTDIPVIFTIQKGKNHTTSDAHRETNAT